jgi:hypothetical protein
MAKLDDLEFRITASTDLLRSELARGANAVQNFSDKSSRHMSEFTGRLTTLSDTVRGLRSAFALLGVGVGLSSFSSWIEGALKTANLTGEQAQVVADATREFQQFKKATDELAVAMAVRLAPSLATAAESWRKFLFPTAGEKADARIAGIEAQISALNKLSRNNLPSFQTPKGGPLGGLFGWLFGSTDTANTTERVNAVIEQIKKLEEERANLIAKTPKESPFAINRQDELALEESLASFANHAADVQQKTESMLDEVVAGSANKRAEIIENDRKFLDNWIAELNTAPQKLSSSLDAFIAEAQRADQVRLANRTDKEVLTDNVAEAKRLMDEGLLSAKDYNAVMDQAKKNAKAFTDSFVAAFESRGIQALLDGDLRGAVRGLAKDFGELVIKLAILKPLAESISGWLTTSGNIFSNVFGGARAGGGPVSAGVPYLVGERGPEMFVPASSGNIVPNGAGGGVHITQVFQVAAIEPTLETQLGMMTRLAAEAARDSVLQSMKGVR